MELLKIDRTKLVRVKTFANQKDVTVQQVYNWIKEKKIKCIEIDGMKFIQV